MGGAAQVTAFRDALVANPPPLAHIETVTAQTIAPKGERDFTIVHSQAQTAQNTLISPDITICDDCLRELFDPNDRHDW